jgi:hypothetical protein
MGRCHLDKRLIHVCRQYTHGKFVELPKTDSGARDIGIDAKLAAELGAWKLAQKTEHRKANSLMVATSAWRRKILTSPARNSRALGTHRLIPGS